MTVHTPMQSQVVQHDLPPQNITTELSTHVNQTLDSSISMILQLVSKAAVSPVPLNTLLLKRSVLLNAQLGLSRENTWKGDMLIMLK